MGLGWVIGKDLDKFPWNKINTTEARDREREEERQKSEGEETRQDNGG